MPILSVYLLLIHHDDYVAGCVDDPRSAEWDKNNQKYQGNSDVPKWDLRERLRDYDDDLIDEHPFFCPLSIADSSCCLDDRGASYRVLVLNAEHAHQRDLPPDR